MSTTYATAISIIDAGARVVEMGAMNVSEAPCDGVPPSGADRPVLDERQLQDVIAGDLDLLATLLALYVEQGEKDLPRLREALAACDGDALGRVAHALRGASSSLGAVRAAAAFAAVEHAGVDVHAGLVERAEVEFAAARAALQARL